MPNESMVTAALFYAEECGLRIIPVPPGEKGPRMKNWPDVATTDSEKIREWWQYEPDSNIAVVTGGWLAVVDTDEKNGKHGEQSLKDWETQFGSPIPRDTWTCKTGSGGYHRYYIVDREFKGAVEVLPGVDIRAYHNCVMAPPSIHPNGNRYTWEISPDDAPIAKANEAIYELLSMGEEDKTSTMKLDDRISKGARNDTLFKLACSLWSKNINETAILNAIRSTNSEQCDPPLSDEEVQAVVKSAIERYPPGGGDSSSPEGKKAPKAKRQRKPIQAITASELDQLDIPPVEWLVEGLLPVGLSLIGAPPKYYKSFMALQLCVEICTGGSFLGYKCNQNACLYLDLESTKRRPKERLRNILGDRPAPDNLFIITGTDDVGIIGDGFEEQMEEQLRQHPDIKLIIVDVFQEIRPPGKKTQNAYDRDYDDMKVLKALADSHNIGVMLIHHTRKMPDEDDVFNQLSGSTGLMGALDAAWLITRSKRDSEESTLHVTGRDLEAVNLQLRFNKDTTRWESLGEVEQAQAIREKEEYEKSPIVKTIRKELEVNGNEWQGAVEELKNDSIDFGSPIPDDVSAIGKKIRSLETQLKETDNISFKDLGQKGQDRKRTILFYRT